MELLTFAHRGEAKSFLKQGNFSPIPFSFDGLYKNEYSFLLIHGEGIQATSEKLSAICGAFRDKIHAVINFGVCGSLIKENVTIGEIYPIRTCYLEAEFKSYTTGNKTGLDIISAKERVLNKDKAKNLSYFAPLVDREVWAVGSVCHLLGLPFYSFKLISDYSDNEEICQMVSSKSEDISDSLYQYFLKLNLVQENKGDDLLPDLYATTSQKRLFNSLSKKMRLKNKKINLLEEDFVNLNPKKKMSKILEQMEKDLSPFDTKLKEQLDILTKNINFDIKFSKDFEDSTIYLASKINSQSDIDLYINSLNSFPYLKIKNLLEGKMDV